MCNTRIWSCRVGVYCTSRFAPRVSKSNFQGYVSHELSGCCTTHRFPHDRTTSFQLPRPQLATEDRFSFHNQKVLLSSSISRLLLLTNHFLQPNLRCLDGSSAGGAAAEAAAGVGVPNPRGGYQEHRHPPQGKEAGELCPQGDRFQLQGRVVEIGRAHV